MNAQLKRALAFYDQQDAINARARLFRPWAGGRRFARQYRVDLERAMCRAEQYTAETGRETEVWIY
ncbi:MAG: hypothetical protein K0U84_13440 [Actinomycetia bacterium]|nr:hypothetical protein [Actinomycetes bacterium]